MFACCKDKYIQAESLAFCGKCSRLDSFSEASQRFFSSHRYLRQMLTPHKKTDFSTFIRSDPVHVWQI